MPYKKPDNDNISTLFAAGDIIPQEMKGTDKFLDVVNWNIRYFHDRDEQRVNAVSRVLSELNADVIVLEEIMDGSLGGVVQNLKANGAGHYEVAYGKTGGNQRVAIMYDLDWVRSKDDIKELFGKGEVVTGEGKDVFPRLPLHGYFTALNHGKKSVPFDFQIVGVHLKSQRGDGADQRIMAAQRLATWLEQDSAKVDADVIVLGDWNEPPSSKTWAAIHNLEKKNKAAFARINDDSNISHLMYRNKNDFGSRLDLQLISVAALPDLKAPPEAVHWKPLNKLLEGTPTGKELKGLIKQISNDISDHMPVVSRFYFDAKN